MGYLRTSLSTLTVLLLTLQGAAAAATTWPPNSGPGGGGGAKQPQCSPQVIALATGIHLNIVGQYGELNATRTLQAIEAASPVDQVAFEIGKGGLLADIAGGMNIRKFNQEIAPAGNAALPGLAQYAMAQSMEQGLAMSLTGVPSHDNSILATLVSDIMSGTMLNERNLANATAGCSLGFTFPADY